MLSGAVAAVVLNWNGKDDTLQCLASLEDQTEVDLSLIVVDNGSTDGSVGEIRRQFPGVSLIETGDNLGYAAGNNVGLKFAMEHGFHYVLVLNNDTELAPDCVSQLISGIQSLDHIAAVAPTIFFEGDRKRVYFAGGRISDQGRPFHEGWGETVNRTGLELHQTEWLTGCALLFRTETLLKTGLFEPKYFLLFEDVDWSLRARRCGYHLGVVSQARLWHKVSRSFGETWSPQYWYYYTRNYLLCLERNYSGQEWLRYFVHAIRCAHRQAFTQSKSMPASQGVRVRRAFGLGIRDYFLRRFGKARVAL